MRKFKSEVVEGQVYKIVYFSVIGNEGKFRASSHEFKILFTSKTKVSSAVSEMIPRTGFSFSNSADILATGGESPYMLGNVFRLYKFVVRVCCLYIM